MHPIDKKARIAGAAYLVSIVFGPFSLIYVPNVIVDLQSAAATANNIRTHEMLFRFGIAADVLNGVIFLGVVLALYRLLKDVDPGLAKLMVILGGIIPAPIFVFTALNWIAALLIVHGIDVSAFDKNQQDTLATLFVRLHSQSNLVNGIFWGLWLFPFGLLVVRSRFLPRLLGVWLIVAGFAYVVNSFTGLLLPQYHELVGNIGAPIFAGEIAIALWLVIKGANVKAL